MSEINLRRVRMATRQTREVDWRRLTATLLMGGWLTWGVVVPGPVRAADEEPTPASRAGSPARPKSKFRDFSEVTADAKKKYEGLFRLYEVDDHLYAEVRPNQFNEMYLAPVAIARGMASAGTPLNFGDEWILSFRRVGDTIQLIRKNVHYEAPKGSPLEKAVEQNYTDSILLALPIISINPMTQGADRFFVDLPHGLCRFGFGSDGSQPQQLAQGQGL